MNKLGFLKYFTCHNVHHPKTHSVVLFTSRKDLWRQLHLDMRLMRCWASAQHDIRYSILLFLRQEHLGQQVKISRRRKHSDYFRQVRCSIFNFDLFHSEHLGRASHNHLDNGHEYSAVHNCSVLWVHLPIMKYFHRKAGDACARQRQKDHVRK